MRSYILTAREEEEVEKYLAGKIPKTSFMGLIIKRAREFYPVLEEQLALLKSLNMREP